MKSILRTNFFVVSSLRYASLLYSFLSIVPQTVRPPRTWFLKLISFAICTLSFPSLAQYDSLSFQSQYGKFSLQRKVDGFYYFGKRKVSLDPIKDFLPLLDTLVEGSCESLPEKPDLTVTARSKDRSGLGKATMKKLSFYIANKTVKKGKVCAQVDGEGIYYLPLHKSWFVGKKQLTIPLTQSLEVINGGELMINVEKHKNGWRNASAGIGTNWDSFRNFRSSLEELEVTHRLHAGIGQGKPNVQLKIDGKQYTAYVIGKNLWALKFPKVDWLVASNDWSAWGDMSIGYWQDRFSPILKKIISTELSEGERIAAAESLGNKWSPSIKRTFQIVLEDTSAPLKLRVYAVKSLRRKPSEDNFESFMKALTTETPAHLLHNIVRALKIKNPGGPKIPIDADQDEIDAAVATWKAWWRQIDK